MYCICTCLLRCCSFNPSLSHFFYSIIFIYFSCTGYVAVSRPCCLLEFNPHKLFATLFLPTGDKAMGLVGQSFCAALQQELTEYYRLLAVLEGQHQVGDAGIVGEGASGSLTLRRLMVWTYDPMMRLRTLAALVDACKGTVI